jgi:large subunit ribosomal protein L21
VPGEVLRIPTLADKVEGDAVEFTEVLAAGDDGGVRIGSPLIEGARVTGTILKQGRSPKVIVFKFKKRKQFKRKQGHRQAFTTVKIDSVA